MNMTPKLTIGMAVVNDRKGVYTTIQHMRLTNQRISECEFVVVDNKPGFSPQSTEIKNYLEQKVNGHGTAARYIPMAEPAGTAPPRNRVFTEAQGDAVLCVDSHILTADGSIDRLIRWYEDHPNTLDLFSGPILYDNLQDTETHFDDIWRSAMWGTWGRAWACSCAGFSYCESDESPLRFTVKPQDNGQAVYFSLAMNPQPVSFCGRCGSAPPDVLYARHQADLSARGYVRLGSSPDEEPFEIPGQGLGLFSCRREAWLGFNEHFRQFGGEEMYIHEKFRQSGRKCINLPFLLWNHDFWKAPGTSYALTNWGKIRNYVLGHNELGLPIDRVHKHFVQGVGMSADERKTLLLREEAWQYLIADPIAHDQPPKSDASCKAGCGGSKKPSRPQPPEELKTADELRAWMKSVPRDLDQHLDKLAELASQCQHITEISKRRESTIGLIACPGKVVSYNVETDELQERLKGLLGERITFSAKQSTAIKSIEPTDMLFIDSQHTANRLHEELTKFGPSVSRWIVCHDTALYGETGEDRGPGLLPAIRRYMTEYSQWSVVYHTQNQYGLTVLGCRAEDKPKLPGMLTMASNFAKALAEHTADGLKKVELPVLQSRLETCMTCPQRNNDQCSVCGCYVAQKAEWRTSMCPLHFWKE